MPRAFLIIDEANDYTEDPELRDHIGRIARTALKTGIHTVVAAHSWRAADVPKKASDQFATRICFRTDNNTSAQVIFDDPKWGQRMTKINKPGRGVLRSMAAHLDMVFFQGYRVSEDELAALLLGSQKRSWSDSAEAAVNTAPVRPQLSNLEHTVFQMALKDSGKITQRALLEWKITDRPTAARRMLDDWRERKLLVKDPNQNQAHVLTELANQLYQQDLQNGFVKTIV
jgi:DNA segregation ATPase FtsK/SpoIIIE-like protein